MSDLDDEELKDTKIINGVIAGDRLYTEKEVEELKKEIQKYKNIAESEKRIHEDLKRQRNDLRNQLHKLNQYKVKQLAQATTKEEIMQSVRKVEEIDCLIEIVKEDEKC